MTETDTPPPASPGPGYAREPATGFNLHVHGARGLFALFVFAFHVVNADLPTFEALRAGAVEAALRTLEYGVELFFCVSGFVILGALRRAPGPGAFLADRVARIYPPLWAAMLAMAAHGLATGAREFGQLSLPEVLAALPANLLALPGVLPVWGYHPVAWSISYEMLFYLLCAAAWWLRPRLGAVAAAALWAPAAAALLVLYPRAIFFVAGLLVAEGLVARLPLAARLARHPLPLLLGFLAAWGGVQALTAPLHLFNTTLLDFAGDARLPLALLALAAAALAFQGIVDGHGALGRLLATCPLLWLGTVSYSFYLWHLPVMGAARRAMHSLGLVEAAGPWAQLLFALLSLPPALLVAWASQRLLEDRARAWLRARLRRPAAPGSSSPAGLARPAPATAGTSPPPGRRR